MNQKQREGMIRLHLKAEQAFRKYGQHEKAEQAKALREKLEREVAE